MIWLLNDDVLHARLSSLIVTFGVTFVPFLILNQSDLEVARLVAERMKYGQTT